MPHSLLIAKVHAYGFDKTSTEYFKDYLSHRHQKIKINKTFSNWKNVLPGVQQGSILGPLIFTVFLYDIFLFKPNINLVSYANDSTPFATGGSSELEVINEIKSVMESLTLWFRNNCKKVNPDKFHLLSDKKSHHVDICNEKLSNTCSEKFFGIKIDNKLTLDEYVEGLCKKASQKVSAVTRISSLMRFEQRKRIVDLFTTSHFSYFPLV